MPCVICIHKILNRLIGMILLCFDLKLIFLLKKEKKKLKQEDRKTSKISKIEKNRKTRKTHGSLKKSRLGYFLFHTLRYQVTFAIRLTSGQ